MMRSTGPGIFVEEGVSACDFDDSAGKLPTYEDWVNTFSEWGAELVETHENLDEKLFEEWLQEKVNPSSKQISLAVEE